MTAPTPDETVARVRRFSRFYTRRIGVLQAALLGSELSLTEGRIVYEIASRATTTATDLVCDLDLGTGYVSRLLKSRGAELPPAGASAADGRQQLIALTRKGRTAFEAADRRSSEEVGAMLGRLGAGDRARLASALATVENLLGERPGAPAVVLHRLGIGDIGWIVHRHAVLYAEEYGWDLRGHGRQGRRRVHRRVRAGEGGRLDRGLDGRPVGSVLLVRKSDTIAKLRLLYVEPDARAATASAAASSRPVWSTHAPSAIGG